MKIDLTMRLCRVCNKPRPIEAFSPRGSVCRGCAQGRAQDRSREEEEGDTRLSFEEFFGGKEQVETVFERAGFVVYEVIEGDRKLWSAPSRPADFEE
jgi:hypothetical protein